MSFHLFGQVVVVLNTAKAAKDLLDKRSAIYSDRPPTPIYEMYVLDSSVGSSAHVNQDGVELGSGTQEKRRTLGSRTSDA